MTSAYDLTSSADYSPNLNFAIKSYRRWQRYEKLRQANLLDYADARNKTPSTLTDQEFWDFAKKFTYAWESIDGNDGEDEDEDAMLQAAAEAREQKEVVREEDEDGKTVKAGCDAETFKVGAAGGSMSKLELVKTTQMLEIENKQLDEDISEWLGEVLTEGASDEK